MDKRSILVSFIIPAYNRQEKLKKTVDSVLNQTFKNIELILVDDASQPSLEPYFEDLKKSDKRVSYFINEKNYGVSFSRNLGLSQANGEYVCFVDSDDYLDVNRIKNQIDYLLNNDLLVCDYFLENHLEKDTKVINQNTGYDLLKRIVNRSLHLATLGIIWSREFLKSNSLQFDPSLRNSEDYLFIVKAILNQPNIHYLSMPLVTVVKSHQDSLTGKFQSKNNTVNKLHSHSKVFFLTFGKIPILDSLTLFKKILGFIWHIIIISKRDSF